MLKKLFDWTPRDIAYWEKIQHKGLWKFIGWYGVVLSSGILFLVFGLITCVVWLRQVSGTALTPASFLFLIWQLIFVAVVCILGGVVNSLITWGVEQRQYRKYKTESEGE